MAATSMAATQVCMGSMRYLSESNAEDCLREACQHSDQTHASAASTQKNVRGDRGGTMIVPAGKL